MEFVEVIQLFTRAVKSRHNDTLMLLEVLLDSSSVLDITCLLGPVFQTFTVVDIFLSTPNVKLCHVSVKIKVLN